MRIDLRAALLTLAPQEVLTSDGVGVRVTAVVRWAVGDPVAFVERAQSPTDVVYLAAQLGLRDAVAALSLEELTQRQTRLATQTLTEVTAQAGRTVGIDVSGVVVRDVILPAELRHAATELLTARQRGLATLETARAETAACAHWPTPGGCWRTTRRWPGCGWCRRRQWAASSCSGSVPTLRSRSTADPRWRIPLGEVRHRGAPRRRRK